MNHIKFRAGIITIVFLAMLAFPWLDGQLDLVGDLPNYENRALAEKPILDSLGLDSFPKYYEAYFSDHFPQRFRMVNWFSKLQIMAFQSSPSPERAIVGRDGWFFMAGNEQNSYTGKYGLPKDELELYRKELEYRSQFVAQNGGKFYFMIAPCKNNIYPEKMPFTQPKAASRSWGESLLDYLDSNSTVRTINPYAALREGHLQAMTYSKLDNHWNNRGAFIAANVMMERLHEDYPKVTPVPITAYDVSEQLHQDGNIVSMFGLNGVFEDSIIDFKLKAPQRAHKAPQVPYEGVLGFPYPYDFELEWEMEDSTKPKLLLITDSFGYSIYPFLTESFSRTLKIFDCWQYKTNEPIVKAEQAQIVVLMVMEGNLRNMKEFMPERKPIVQ